MTSSPSPTHHDVLAVAERLYAREGASALSVRRIADALGVSRQIVYSRYTDKSGLVRALHRLGFERLVAAMAAVPDRPGSTERLVAMAAAYRSYALAEPALYELMFGRPVTGWEPDDEARAVARAGFEPVLDAVGQWAGRHRPGLTAHERVDVALSVWSGTHGVVSLELAGLVGDRAPGLVRALVLASLGADR